MARSEVKGLSDVLTRMARQEQKMRIRTIRKAAVIGANDIRDEAKRIAPVLQVPTKNRTRGTVKAALRSKGRVQPDKSYEVTVWVKGLSKDAKAKFKSESGLAGSKNPKDPFYWWFLEFGTAKMQARPFIRPAFNRRKIAARDKIFKYIRLNTNDK